MNRGSRSLRRGSAYVYAAANDAVAVVVNVVAGIVSGVSTDVDLSIPVLGVVVLDSIGDVFVPLELLVMKLVDDDEEFVGI